MIWWYVTILFCRISSTQKHFSLLVINLFISLFLLLLEYFCDYVMWWWLSVCRISCCNAFYCKLFLFITFYDRCASAIKFFQLQTKLQIYSIYRKGVLEKPWEQHSHPKRACLVATRWSNIWIGRCCDSIFD